MLYPFLSFIAVTIFALIHIYAYRIKRLDPDFQAAFLSFGGGVAIAYVFINLLPKLCLNDVLIKQTLAGTFPYFERHVFIMALLGFILFFLVDRAHGQNHDHRKYWLSIASYALFNFLIGYAVVDPNNPEVRPLMLFTFAIGLHYFANDYSLDKRYGKEYEKNGKWILILFLYAGWFVGSFTKVPPIAIALVSAFIGGGVIMNVTRHEIPRNNPRNLWAFLAATFFYTILLLAIGT